MAVTNGAVWSVNLLRGNDESDVQLAEVYFTVTGTYAQANNSILSGVGALITAVKKNGKTATIRSVCAGQPGRRSSDNSIMWPKTVAISGSDVTFELVNNADYSTEFADATAIPAMSAPMSILVSYTEA